MADTSNNRVQKFDSSGTYLTKWGSNGSGDGQFSFPRGIAIDSSDNVYVADTINHRIQKFDSSGTYLTQWGSIGSGDGQFSTPNGIAIDSSDNVYVADLSNNRIQKFDSDGDYVSQIGGPSFGNDGCTAVNTDGSDGDYFYNPANAPFTQGETEVWDQDTWYFSGSALPTLCDGDCSTVTNLASGGDYDSDNITNGVEDGAPNNGDGNNDSVKDSLQPHVTTWRDASTNKYVTLVAPPGSTITSVADSTATADGNFTYPYDLISFTLTGVTPGSTNDISVFFHDPTHELNELTPRKYFPSTQTFQSLSELTEADLSSVTIDGDPVMKLTYSVADGGILDLDGSANGSITDPVGLGVETSSESGSGGLLADTGASRGLYIIITFMLIALGLALRLSDFARQGAKF